MMNRGILLLLLATSGCAHPSVATLPPLDPCPAPEIVMSSWVPVSSAEIPASITVPPEYRVLKRPSTKMRYPNRSWRRVTPDSLAGVLTAVVEPPRTALGDRDPGDPSFCVEMVGGHPLLIHTTRDPNDLATGYVTVAYWYMTPESGIRFYGNDHSPSGQSVTLAILRTIKGN